MTASDLRAWIERRRLSREAAAALLGLSRRQLDHRLSGQNRIEGPLARLCDFLDQPDHRLSSDRTPPTPE